MDRDHSCFDLSDVAHVETSELSLYYESVLSKTYKRVEHVKEKFSWNVRAAARRSG